MPEIFILNDTFRRNIAFRINDHKIDDHRIAVGVELSNLGSAINELNDDLQTTRCEGDTRLSGGQRQRVVIACALYCDPDVLIFDKATSAPDVETEREITGAIDRLKGKKTIIVISPKLSIVSKCDDVVFMDYGQVADKGLLKTLIANNDRFRQFAQDDNESFGQ